MSLRERKQRERADRHRLIISVARELAETEGWDAVTTRRLAERIEYSQPVLYSHFRGKDEIVAAVALEGFAELTDAVRRAVVGARNVRTEVAAVANAYVAFAGHHPAVYEAMFSLNTGLPFADPATPALLHRCTAAPLHEAFQALLDTLGRVTAPVAPGLFVEVVWAALHGVVTLTSAGRLPPAAHRATDRRSGGPVRRGLRSPAHRCPRAQPGHAGAGLARSA